MKTFMTTRTFFISENKSLAFLAFMTEFSAVFLDTHCLVHLINIRVEITSKSKRRENSLLKCNSKMNERKQTNFPHWALNTY